MKKKVSVGINGFGRIGRMLLRVLLGDASIRVGAINDLAEPTAAAHLFKYDSVHGKYPGDVHLEGATMAVGGQNIPLLGIPETENLPWAELGVDLVFECTGRSNGIKARGHLKSGAKRVIISAPAEGADLTVVLGVNHGLYDPKSHKVVSNASCTTNCLAPVARVIHDTFGIEKGLVTTIHSYTNDQKLLDSGHVDLRRARSAALSIIPTTTGAANAVGLVLPELKGKLDGVSVRVPTPDVSLADITLQLSRDATAAEVNQALYKASEGALKGILGYTEEPLVSSDYLGSPFSAIVDGPQTRQVGGNLIKISAWYDNEWGYANRLADLARFLTK